MIDVGAIKTILTTIVRQLLSAGVGGVIVWASKRGFDLSGDYAIVIGASAVFLVNVAWAAGERLLRRWKLTEALNLPSGSTHADLDAIEKSVPVTTRITEAIKVPSNQQ